MEDLEIWTPEQYQAYINGEKSTGSAPGTEKLKVDQEKLLRLRAEERIKQLEAENKKLKRKIKEQEAEESEELRNKKDQLSLYILGSMIFFIVFALMLLAR